MKAIFCLAVVCAVAAFVSAETCRAVRDCAHVTCPEAAYQLECHNRECTCTQGDSTCSTQSDCGGSDCRFGWHCVDAKCRCGWGIGK